MKDWMIYLLREFAEENWTAFLQRCKDGGIPEEDIEKEFNNFEN